MITQADRPEHGYDVDTDRCHCGGTIVYFEDGDREGEVGLGCEVAGRVWSAPDAGQEGYLT
jgi:hypothetical protein